MQSVLLVEQVKHPSEHRDYGHTENIIRKTITNKAQKKSNQTEFKKNKDGLECEQTDISTEIKKQCYVRMR